MLRALVDCEAVGGGVLALLPSVVCLVCLVCLSSIICLAKALPCVTQGVLTPSVLTCRHVSRSRSRRMLQVCRLCPSRASRSATAAAAHSPHHAVVPHPRAHHILRAGSTWGEVRAHTTLLQACRLSAFLRLSQLPPHRTPLTRLPARVCCLPPPPPNCQRTHRFPAAPPAACAQHAAGAWHGPPPDGYDGP